MKTVIDCRLYSQTGVGRYIRAILAYLKTNATRSNDEYVLIALASEAEFFSNFPTNIKIIKTSVKWHSLKEQFVIPYLLYKEKPDLVHFPYFNVPVFYFGRFIVTIHDLTISAFKTGKATALPKVLYWIKKIFYYLVVFSAIKRSCLILTVSKSVKHEIIKKYGIDGKKIKVVYNGSELENDRQQIAESRLQKDEKNPSANWRLPSAGYILYVGNLHPHKNIETLILAYDDLIKTSRFADLKLVIVSGFDFFYKKLFEFIKNLKLENKIEFTGPLSNYSLIDFYKKAKVLVFPSRAEGFGIPGVEAMRLGCPVIASKIDVFEEIYGDAALYFLPKNSVDLHEKIIKIFEDKAIRDKCIDLGLKRAKLFSWENTAKKIIEIYEMCLKEDEDYDSGFPLEFTP